MNKVKFLFASKFRLTPQFIINALKKNNFNFSNNSAIDERVEFTSLGTRCIIT